MDDQRATSSGLLIGGEVIAAKAGASFPKLEPYGGGLIAQVASARAEDAHLAADAAAAAFPGWSASPPALRREVLSRAADRLHETAGEWIRLMQREIGATTAWAGFNVHLAEGVLREAAAQVYALKGELIPSNVPGLSAMAERVPAGVVLGIAPWNAPLILAARAIAMPLALGNTVVLKASEETPLTHLALGRLLMESGCPAGVVNVVTNAPEDAGEVVEALIAHPAVRRINFTGSTRVGRIIAESAGRHLKKVLLELGGKAPFVVLDDADLDAAAAAANFGAFMNQGQICMSTERMIVDRRVAAEFTEKLVMRAQTLKLGAPDAPDTTLGPVASLASAQRLAELVRDAVDKGARVLIGGEASGLLVPATLIAGVTPAMRLYHEESFGPVKSIIEVDGEEEALRVANDSQYGLAAAVFTRDTERGLRFARAIQSGICHINGPTVHDEPQMPFGGVKDSGYGRFGGSAAVDEFTDIRWITVQSGPRSYPI